MSFKRTGPKRPSSLCRKDREDLAKAALIERQKAADMADGLREEIKVIDDTLKSYEADIAKLQGKLREARARQNAIADALRERRYPRPRPRAHERQPHRGRLLRSSRCSSAAPTSPKAAPTRLA